MAEVDRQHDITPSTMNSLQGFGKLFQALQQDGNQMLCGDLTFEEFQENALSLMRLIGETTNAARFKSDVKRMVQQTFLEAGHQHLHNLLVGLKNKNTTWTDTLIQRIPDIDDFETVQALLGHVGQILACQMAQDMAQEPS